jgi:diguanylate cyclase (GGDEF)-like protein
MTGTMVGYVLVPGFVATLLLLLFCYLYDQSGQQFFRSWQIGWVFYCGSFLASAYASIGHQSTAVYIAARLLLLVAALTIFVSTRLLTKRYEFRWYEAGLAVAGLLLTASNLYARRAPSWPHLEFEVGIGLVFVWCAIVFYRHGLQVNGAGFKLLSIAMVTWAVVLSAEQLRPLVTTPSLFAYIGTIPQMLLGMAMVVVLFEGDRQIIRDNALAFSTLDVDTTRLLTPVDLLPGMTRVVRRFMELAHSEHGAICFAGEWTSTLPSVNQGVPDQVIATLYQENLIEYLDDLAYRQGGFACLRNAPTPADSSSAVSVRQARIGALLSGHRIESLIVLSLRTRERDFGCLLLSSSSHTPTRFDGRILSGLAAQFSVTLDNYVLMHEALRHTKEYQLLTQIGQAISSRLDPDEILRTVHKELGQLFEVESFIIAFQEGNEIRFEFQVIEGVLQPKHSRKQTNALTEHILRTGQPLLIQSEMDKARARLGLVPTGKGAKSYCGVPIVVGGRPAGVMAALSYTHEFAYDERDVEVMQTAAGQVAVSIENARLFAQEQTRAQYLKFLNNVSNAAISSQDAELMLAEIIAQVQKNFKFDHIGIGVLDYATKEIEIKAEAGTSEQALLRRFPLGYGIVGRVARTNDTVLLQQLATAPEAQLQTVLPGANSVLCIPIAYGETLLGVLNVESARENAFLQQEVLILRTLADLLATALHNAFVFQKMQQQSITDSLTGIKTRRFFLESLQSEWKRASRTGRPFSIVLIDLDNFKEVNDTLGHLEGDLVLARVARLLEQKCRQSNVVARYGGDEFVILMPETSLEQGQVLSERLRLWLATDPMLNQHQITGSFGLATYPIHGTSAEEVLRVADAGMYVSKHAGGNRVSTVEEMHESEDAVLRRQLLTTYVQGFVQREHTGPEFVDELVENLRKHACVGPDSRKWLMNAIDALSRAVETREVHAAGHGSFVSRHAVAVARELGLSEDEIADLAYAARVHDVGKIIIPERILCKPGKLSAEEYALVKNHSAIGARIVGTIPESDAITAIIRHHHERVDGGGYPDKLIGEQIPIGARIICVADAYVSMIADRPFVEAHTSNQAMDELEANSGTQFDGLIVRLFLRYMQKQKAESA